MILEKKSTFLLRSFIKIESLSEDLFCTGDIETLDYCMEVYRQFINNETLDFFIEQSDEIKSALHKLRDELDKFAHYLNDLLTTLFFFLPQNIEEIYLTQVNIKELQTKLNKHLQCI